jgi:hypothetical protein
MKFILFLRKIKKKITDNLYFFKVIIWCIGMVLKTSILLT